jgi:hypothetical protein
MEVRWSPINIRLLLIMGGRPMVISSISRIGRLDWFLGGAHMDRVCVCVVSVL